MAYNECDSIPGVVADVLSELARLGISFEVLVVDDGSSDGTGDAAGACGGSTRGLRVIRHLTNGGLGSVYRTGLAKASGTFLTFIPADGQFPAFNIGRLYARAPACDAVFGYYEGRRDGLLAEVLSCGERFLYTAIVGRMPRFQGMVMIRRSLLSEITLTSAGRGWGVLMELVLRIHRAGYRTDSVSTVVVPRKSGRSKVRNLRTILANLSEMFALRKQL